MGTIVISSDHLRDYAIAFCRDAALTFDVLESLLGAYGVELRFEDLDGHTVLRAYSACRLGAHPNEILSLHESDRLVTGIYNLKRGDPAEIAAAVRTIVVPLRRGSVILLRESRTLVVTGQRSSVQESLLLAEGLDESTLRGSGFAAVPSSPATESSMTLTPMAVVPERRNVREELSRLKSIKITEIVDGGTFELDDGRRVRILGIDAPSRREEHDRDASDALRKLVMD
ncbi:hypothetical protein ACFL59_11035, partial [Planctomycetota bacterium]